MYWIWSEKSPDLSICSIWDQSDPFWANSGHPERDIKHPLCSATRCIQPCLALRWWRGRWLSYNMCFHYTWLFQPGSFISRHSPFHPPVQPQNAMIYLSREWCRLWFVRSGLDVSLAGQRQAFETGFSVTWMRRHKKVLGNLDNG